MSDEQAGQKAGEKAGQTRLVSLWVEQLPPDERKAVYAVVEAGEKFGYPKMVSHLRRAWKVTMMNHYDFPDDYATTSAANSVPYPVDDSNGPNHSGPSSGAQC